MQSVKTADSVSVNDNERPIGARQSEMCSVRSDLALPAHGVSPFPPALGAANTLAEIRSFKP